MNLSEAIRNFRLIEAELDGEQGRWVTTNGRHIFISSKTGEPVQKIPGLTTPAPKEKAAGKKAFKPNKKHPQMVNDLGGHLHGIPGIPETKVRKNKLGHYEMKLGKGKDGMSDETKQALHSFFKSQPGAKVQRFVDDRLWSFQGWRARYDQRSNKIELSPPLTGRFPARRGRPW